MNASRIHISLKEKSRLLLTWRLVAREQKDVQKYCFSVSKSTLTLLFVWVFDVDIESLVLFLVTNYDNSELFISFWVSSFLVYLSWGMSFLSLVNLCCPLFLEELIESSMCLYQMQQQEGKYLTCSFTLCQSITRLIWMNSSSKQIHIQEQR